MKIKNRLTKIAVWVVLVLFPNVSCTDWLDVQPREQEEAEKLFETEDGFKEALAGCYTNLSQTSAYGKELTFGFVSVLGQEWSSGAGVDVSSAAYYQVRRYNYEDANVLPFIDNIWAVLYNTIAQLNTLIYYTEQKREVLSDLNYAIIRGEAFALRAFVHSELFRLYADVVGMIPENNKISLPYVTTTKPVITPQSTNKEFYDSILLDIAEALALLEKDPVYTGINPGDADNGYLVNRQFHLNYYAVLGLKARINFYYGDKTAALQTARTIIEANNSKNIFPWILLNNINTTNVNLRDRTFSTEQLFAFNVVKLEENIKGYFRETSSPLVSRIPTAVGVANSLFPAAGDYRRLFFETYNGMNDVYSRFWQMPSQQVSGVTTRPERDRIPVIRITEIYYIAAESLIGVDNSEALSLLNEVRTHRGITALPDTPIPADMEIQEEILKEYQREFLGEGQLFFYHKRLNTTYINTANADYILPLPSSEWDLGMRTKIK
jgi:hypothetical protein